MIKRRDFLTGTLGAAIGATGGVFLSSDDEIQELVSNIQMLKTLFVNSGKNRHIVTVLGYGFAGDGGGKIMYWDPRCELAENGGTIIASDINKQGRWRQLHQGVLDFRQFGIFNAEYPADNALEAMVNDPDVRLVQAFSDLNLIRRHRFTRSELTLDFGHHTITTQGIEAADPLAPYLGAVMLFTGAISGDTVTAQVEVQIPELSDIFPVGDNRIFSIGSWYRMESGIRKGRSERVIQRLVQVTEHIGVTHIRVNYKTGFVLPAGESLLWTLVSPVENITVMNLKFSGSGAFPENGSQPLALEYAVNCNVQGVHATGTFWPVIFRRWNTGYRTEQCSLINPSTVKYGGAGYLTQQIYCLYGHVSDCTTSNARHLNDFTASAFCFVENCHATGDAESAFTTHGQYEHDLIYQGNSGVISLANSGYQWGQSARRIRVDKHVCTMLLADTLISDVTLTDVNIRRTSLPDGPGVLRANTDGLQMRGCSIDGELTLVKHTNDSRRPTLIEGCGLQMDNRHDLAISDFETTAPHVGDPPQTLPRNTINGSGRLIFAYCTFNGNTPNASWWLNGEYVHFTGCQFRDLSLRLSGSSAQKIVFSGDNELTGPGTPAPLLGRTGIQPVYWKIESINSRVKTVNGIHICILSGENRGLMRDNTFSGGKCLLARAHLLKDENNQYQDDCQLERSAENIDKLC